MDFVEQRQIFKLGSNGSLYFSHTKVLLYDGDNFLCGKSKRRISDQTKLSQSLEDLKTIPKDDYQPTCFPQVSIVSSPSELHVKRPRLIDYTGGRNLVDRMIREIYIYEMLKGRPQANIAEYKGCLVPYGRIEGICLQRYACNLMEELNPDSLNKRDFARKTTLPEHRIYRYISGLKAGLDHLHSLGYVHNDINPSNVMLSADNIPVIIDFDSCVKIGASLRGLRRTYGWYDESVQEAVVTNDVEAVEEIESWLSGNAYKFKFP